MKNIHDNTDDGILGKKDIHDNYTKNTLKKKIQQLLSITINNFMNLRTIKYL